MMDFNDLARSGTAPEPAKVKSSQITGSTMGIRPKTRSAENDMYDFNIDLRTNKLSNQKQTFEQDDMFMKEERGEFRRTQEEEEYIKAIASFQADVEASIASNMSTTHRCVTLFRTIIIYYPFHLP